MNSSMIQQIGFALYGLRISDNLAETDAGHLQWPKEQADGRELSSDSVRNSCDSKGYFGVSIPSRNQKLHKFPVFFCLI